MITPRGRMHFVKKYISLKLVELPRNISVYLQRLQVSSYERRCPPVLLRLRPRPPLQQARTSKTPNY